MSKKKKVVIAGASGFIGQKFIALYKDKYDIIALSRSNRTGEGVEHRQCDLFSLLDAEAGVEGADYALYLVHSMLPSARLSQGEFEDYDLIVADNFARACERAGVEQIVYLGGITPTEKRLSRHLSSRLEVEKVFQAHQTPTTSLRSGLVLGRGGSTALMLVKLVERLRVMICPSWTRTPTQAIDVDDACRLMEHCFGKKELFSRNFDIGSGPSLSYRRLLELTAQALGVKRRFIDVPFFTPLLSHLWLTLITGAPRSLTKPIVESLRHPIECRDHELEKSAQIEVKAVKESLQDLTQKIKGDPSLKPRAFSSIQQDENVVRSVQRLFLPPDWSAEKVAKRYLTFLDTHSLGLISVKVTDVEASFQPLFFPITLLKIELSQDRSSSNRQLFYITGGLLNHRAKRERLEFRIIPGVNALICGLHEFYPRLPWWIYVFTQAPLHAWVMKRFSNYLRREAAAS